MLKNSLISATMLLFVISANAACASSMVYTGHNPDITPTANPNNESSIAALASLTRPAQPVAPQTNQSTAQLVKNSVLASLSSTITQQLTGTTVGSGTANFGDGSYAQWSTSVVGGVTTRTIIIHNLDGTSTTISFPL